MKTVNRVRAARYRGTSEVAIFRGAASRLMELQRRRAAAQGRDREAVRDDIEDEIIRETEVLLTVRTCGLESIVCKALYLKEAIGGVPDDLVGELTLSLCRDILSIGQASADSKRPN